MLTVFRILFGKDVKIGNDLADKGSSLSFFYAIQPYKNSYRSFTSMANKLQGMT